mgnify:CR=1 FL=1
MRSIAASCAGFSPFHSKLGRDRAALRASAQSEMSTPGTELWTPTGLYKAAMSKTTTPGYNGWNKYGVLFTLWTGALVAGAIVVMNVWGPDRELMDQVKLRDPKKQIGDGHRPPKTRS